MTPVALAKRIVEHGRHCGELDELAPDPDACENLWEQPTSQGHPATKSTLWELP